MKGLLNQAEEEKLVSLRLFEEGCFQNGAENDKKRSPPSEIIPDEGETVKRQKTEDKTIKEKYEQSTQERVTNESTPVKSGPIQIEEDYDSYIYNDNAEKLQPSLSEQVPKLPSISARVDPTMQHSKRIEDVPLEHDSQEDKMEQQAKQGNGCSVPRDVGNVHGTKHNYSASPPSGVYMRTTSNAVLMRLTRLYNITGSTVNPNDGLLEKLENLERVFYGDGTKVRGIFIHRLRMLENELLTPAGGDLNFQYGPTRDR